MVRDGRRPRAALLFASLAAAVACGCAGANPGDGRRQAAPDLHGAQHDLEPAALPDLSYVPNTWDLSMMGHPDLSRGDLTDGGGGPDLAGDDLAMNMGGGNCHPVVNEILTGTNQAATEEFVELYNPCGDVDLTGWTLGYHSAKNGAGPSTTLSGTFTGGTYLVLCGAHLWGPPRSAFCDGQLAGGLAAAGGAVAIVDGKRALVDGVSYDALSAPNDFTERAPAPNPPTADSPGGTIGRLPNGTDTDDNQADLKVTAAPTPRAPNR